MKLEQKRKFIEMVIIADTFEKYELLFKKVISESSLIIIILS